MVLNIEIDKEPKSVENHSKNIKLKITSLIKIFKTIRKKLLETFINLF